MSETESSGRVVVLATDLMDRSKISGAFPAATFVRSPERLVQEATSATLVLVDLTGLGDAAVLTEIQARVVAYGSHLNHNELTAAEAAGAEALPRSVFFRRLSAQEL